ncbi:peptidoglycan recognition protein family protein [Paenibacillus harenae]|uniref:peptidoglycan recognition protein family protein n=1 Tax=Paenibacillus harenae TaxID=306543 RepID=UPI002791FA58|nr:N-acetylmuramoyl-L-alanine amidase [Paenibacillus harenae]MDQ0063569.1 N-acetylmuramoyl-L-alanine amidase CwlA [Paenibacillus harenae]
MGAVNYIIDHIPLGTPCNRRPAHPMLQPTTITVHNTGNPSSTARNERDWLANPTNNRTASYHIVVDEHQAIECIPIWENSWHAGDGSVPMISGNRTSISIEICESGNYERTLDQATELVARLLTERGWGIERLRRHYDWSGKICPRLMYDKGRWTGWLQFKQRVTAKLAQTTIGGETMTKEEKALLESIKTTVQHLAQRVEYLENKQRMNIPAYAQAAVEAAVGAGLLYEPEESSEDFYRLLTIIHRKGLI